MSHAPAANSRSKPSTMTVRAQPSERMLRLLNQSLMPRKKTASKIPAKMRRKTLPASHKSANVRTTRTRVPTSNSTRLRKRVNPEFRSVELVLFVIGLCHIFSPSANFRRDSTIYCGCDEPVPEAVCAESQSLICLSSIYDCAWQQAHSNSAWPIIVCRAILSKAEQELSVLHQSPSGRQPAAVVLSASETRQPQRSSFA